MLFPNITALEVQTRSIYPSLDTLGEQETGKPGLYPTLKNVVQFSGEDQKFGIMHGVSNSMKSVSRMTANFLNNRWIEGNIAGKVFLATLSDAIHLQTLDERISDLSELKKSLENNQRFECKESVKAVLYSDISQIRDDSDKQRTIREIKIAVFCQNMILLFCAFYLFKSLTSALPVSKLMSLYNTATKDVKETADKVKDVASTGLISSLKSIFTGKKEQKEPGVEVETAPKNLEKGLFEDVWSTVQGSAAAMPKEANGNFDQVWSEVNFEQYYTQANPATVKDEKQTFVSDEASRLLKSKNFFNQILQRLTPSLKATAAQCKTDEERAEFLAMVIADKKFGNPMQSKL